jgi:TRAP transporter TAXI family solute receptor
MKTTIWKVFAGVWPRPLAAVWLAVAIAAEVLLGPAVPWLLPETGVAAAQTIVRIATTPPGRLNHTVVTGIAEILTKHSKLAPRVLPVGLALSWAPMMERKDTEFAAAGDPFEAYRIYHGIEEFQGPTGGKGIDIRYVLSGAPLPVSFLVRKDSDIHKLGDLKGKPVPVGYTAAKVFDYYQRAILANAGLTYQDIVPVPVAEIARARELFTQGRVVTAGTWAPGIAPVLEMDSAFGIRFLSLDPSPEAVKRMAQASPGSYVIPAGKYVGKPGVRPDTYFLGIELVLVVHSGMSDQLVYEVVKTLWEHNDELRKFHLALEDWKREGFVNERATIPYHPGAIRLYQEKGVWPPAMAQLNERLLRR